MAALVQALQVASGVLWLAVAFILLPRIPGAWRDNADKLMVISARNAFLAWLMFGFSLRWLVWSDAVHLMGRAELTCWAALYALSCLCALWFMTGAIENRGR